MHTFHSQLSQTQARHHRHWSFRADIQRSLEGSSDPGWDPLVSLRTEDQLFVALLTSVVVAKCRLGWWSDCSWASCPTVQLGWVMVIARPKAAVLHSHQATPILQVGKLRPGEEVRQRPSLDEVSTGSSSKGWRTFTLNDTSLSHGRERSSREFGEISYLTDVP